MTYACIAGGPTPSQLEPEPPRWERRVLELLAEELGIPGQAGCVAKLGKPWWCQNPGKMWESHIFYWVNQL